ncbi:cytochrome c [Flammeovirgaceae bacterium SG7u.111]|nr:cytochrome c [Flammeovirgaceae bacterium SG7u.132]WPO37788.1 cytochrome c [Flammeovirgaceae bacterium SG7u.111]
MKKNQTLGLIITLLAFFMFSCGGKEKKSETPPPPPPAETKTEAPAPEAEKEVVSKAGKVVYLTYCAVCHQEDGNGIAGMNPPLTETEWVNGDKTRLINIVLNGLSEEIEVKGEAYNNVMAPHDFLTDKQIADVLTYVRGSFGNESDAVTEAEVAEARAAK